MTAIKIENLIKIYKSVGKQPEKVAVNGMSLEIKKGEFVGILLTSQ